MSTPRGFSEKTCFPASSAASICQQCSEEVVTTATASISASANILLKSVYRAVTPSCRAYSGRVVQAAVSRAPGILQAMFSAWTRPRRPSPAMPMRRVFILFPPSQSKTGPRQTGGRAFSPDIR